MPCINRAEQQGLREKGRARVRGSRAEGEHRQHLKLMSKQSEGLIEGQRKTQRDDALHEDPCVDLVCRKVCKKERYVKGGNRRTRMRSVSLSLNTAACQRRAAKWSKVYPVSSE